MIDIDIWMKDFLKALDETFKQRVWFVGIQGSYARGEATENSDIDMVVILDELTINDLQIYDRMLDTLSYRELICGFLSGKGELMNWNAADLFQFYYDTKPIKGSLDDLLVLIDDTALNRAIKTGVCNIYHGCVHNILYDKSEDILKGLYKAASFVVQAIYFKQTGHYIRQQSELLKIVLSEERIIVDAFLTIKNGGVIDFKEMSNILFTWSQKWLINMNNL